MNQKQWLRAGMWGVCLALGLAIAPLWGADKTPPARNPETSTAPATKAARLKDLPKAPRKPETLADLKAIQNRVEAVVKQNMPATVGLIVGGAQGSGVIVKGDGTILTAGHVSMEAGKDIVVILHDGKRVKGKTLGANDGIDSGMARIVDKPKDGGEWPHVDMGESRTLESGEWVVSMGHPGGYRAGRPPVVRLGRVLLNNARLIGTDCTLIGGDSGGPLFDLDGNLVGIHSRIGATASTNIHVPIDTYTQTWERLAAGEMWGGRDFDLLQPRRTAGPSLGVTAIDDEAGARISKLSTAGPAEKAGLKVGDVVQKINGGMVKSTQDLVAAINKQKPGDSVKMEVLREGKPLEVPVKLGRKSL